MEKEFNLIKKRIWFKGNDGLIYYVFLEEDVKEFIRRLKEESLDKALQEFKDNLDVAEIEFNGVEL